MGANQQSKRARKFRKMKFKQFPAPPDRDKFCLNCNRTTRWKYNPEYGHSECTECGCRFTKRKVQEIKKKKPW